MFGVNKCDTQHWGWRDFSVFFYVMGVGVAIFEFCMMTERKEIIIIPHNRVFC